MDIAKIRKKLKQGGRKKTRKSDDSEIEKTSSAPSDISATETKEMSGSSNSSSDTGTALAVSSLPEETVPESHFSDDDAEDAVPVMDLLSFKVSSQYYAFKVDDVQEMLKKQPVTPVPGAAPFLVGITSLRGTIIPVMDLNRRLVTDKLHEYGKRAKIMVIYGPKGSIGVMIESAVTVMSVPVTSVDRAPEGLSEKEMRFISAVTRESGRLVFIVNVDELFNFSAKVEAR